MLEFFDSLHTDVGIDLGAANTLICLKHQGIALQEPSVVAVDDRTGKVLAVGKAAKQMVGRTPQGISTVRPLRHGVIADFELAAVMLRHLLRQALQKRSFVRSRAVISVPCGVTNVERRAVIDAALEAGVKEAYLLEEPLAAALGAGLPIKEATGLMVVNLGGGTTEVAVISLGQIVFSRTLRLGGAEMDDALVRAIKKKYNLLIGEQMAETIKLEIGTLRKTTPSAVMEIRGRDLLTGLPQSRLLDQNQVREALLEPVRSIVETIRGTLEQMPSEMAADVLDRGIVLTGGAALLRDLDWVLTRETGLTVVVAENALGCVALGTGRAAENMNLFHKGHRPAGSK